MKCERRERTRERKRRKGQKKKARKSVTGHATEEYGSLRTAGDHHYGEDISQQLRKRGGKKIIKRKSHGEPRRSRGEVEESHGEPRRATERPQTKKNWEKPRRVIKETRGTKMRWTLTRKNLLPCPSRSPLFHFSLSLSLSLSVSFLCFVSLSMKKYRFPPQIIKMICFKHYKKREREGEGKKKGTTRFRVDSSWWMLPRIEYQAELTPSIAAWERNQRNVH